MILLGTYRIYNNGMWKRIAHYLGKDGQDIHKEITE